MTIKLTDDNTNFNEWGIALKIIPQTREEAMALKAMMLSANSLSKNISISDMPGGAKPEDSPYLSAKILLQSVVNYKDRGKLSLK